MQWADVARLKPIRLNLGGYGDCHPKPDYQGYVSVDLESVGEWSVGHDLTQPIPLPDNSVERILSEHFFEHIEEQHMDALLRECHRLLQPGGIMRIAVPDYHSPRNLKYLRRGDDPTHTDHRTLTTYPLLKGVAERSPFGRFEFFHYWHEGRFVMGEVDYSLGMVKRTPDHDKRNRRVGLWQKGVGAMRDALYVLSRGFRVSRNDLLVQRGHPLRMTSIILDLYKD